MNNEEIIALAKKMFEDGPLPGTKMFTSKMTQELFQKAIAGMTSMSEEEKKKALEGSELERDVVFISLPKAVWFLLRKVEKEEFGKCTTSGVIEEAILTLLFGRMELAAVIGTVAISRYVQEAGNVTGRSS